MVAARTLVAFLAAFHVAFKDDLRVGRHLQRHRLAGRDLHRLAAQKTGEHELVDAGRQRRGGGIRHLLRVVDWLPIFYVLGAALIWATPSNQRIGDVAARSAAVRTKLVTVSRLDDATLPVVPWSPLTSSRRAPSPHRP